MDTGPTDAALLQHVRQNILVIDESGTIVRAVGGSMGFGGRSVDDLVGRNTLEFIAPDDYEAMLFAFTGDGGHIVRDRQPPFPLRVLAVDGSTEIMECIAERATIDGERYWVASLISQAVQPASFHALDAYVAGQEADEIASIVARLITADMGDAVHVRSFVMSDRRDGTFHAVGEPRLPGSPPAHGALLGAMLRHVDDPDAPWSTTTASGVVAVDLSALPSAVVDAARDDGLVVAALSVAAIGDEPGVAMVSFGNHANAFEGTVRRVLERSNHVVEMALQRRQAEDVLRKEAHQDSLTGVGNRLHFNRELEQSSVEDVAVLFIDVDHLKAINDTYGHAVGDAVLVEVAGRISEACRADDVIARIGGDEFAVLLRGCDDDMAVKVGKRIIERIGARLPDGIGPEQVTATAGFAAHRGDDDVASIVERADMAMLAGKRSGRDRLLTS